jgi:alpha-1,3/alpha-1,6-mannosyltransferase
MSSLPIPASPPGCSRLISQVSRRNHVSCIQVSTSFRTSQRVISGTQTLLWSHRACSSSYTLSVPYTVFRDRPTLLSFNRFEKKKNVALAIDAFALFKQQLTKVETRNSLQNLRLIVGGGYDPRVEENMMTLVSLVDRTKAASLTYTIITPPSSKTTIPPFNMTHKNPDVLFILNFSTAQRAALLSAPTTLALLYTPANEHFGIVPVEAMSSGLPVLACNSGGPTESVVNDPPHARTGWLRAPEPASWASALLEIADLSPDERSALAGRARARAREHFGMEAMGRKLESALVEAAKMGRVPVPAVLWFGSFAVVALLAYFMAIVYAS